MQSKHFLPTLFITPDAAHTLCMLLYPDLSSKSNPQRASDYKTEQCCSFMENSDFKRLGYDIMDSVLDSSPQ